MKRTEQLDQALRGLRSEHRQHIRPPLEIERMQNALQLISRPPTRVRGIISLAATGACIALFLAFYHPFGRVETPESQPAPITVFLALPSGAVLPPSANTTFVCIRLHKEDLRQFGVDIPEIDGKQIVRAEFALGDDGLARAVRLVGPAYGARNHPAFVSSR
jgi:hypothetical protein